MLDIFERFEEVKNPDIEYFVVGKQAKQLIETLPNYKYKADKDIIGHYKGIPIVYLENMKEDEIFAFYKGEQNINDDPIYVSGEIKETWI